MRMRRAIVACLALGASLAVPSAASAITGNYQDDFVHDYVGMLVFYTAPDATGDYFSHRCSGTLISPTVVVTAGHCTEGVDSGRMYFQQSVAPNYDPNAFGGWGGDPTTGYPYQGGVTFSRADNYGFRNFEDYPENRDVGVVLLDQAYTPPSGQYGVLPTAGAIDRYLAQVGSKKRARFVTSGYGVTDQDPVVVSFRERLMAESYLVESKSSVTPYNLKTTANPSQNKGGSCNGDSGGPVFFKGTNVIAAVVSYGMNPQCKGLDFSYRLDRTAVLNWINDINRPDAG